MTANEHIENVVLGGGEAGKYIAWELAQQGRPVVVIERALVGGSCPNIACLPSKNIIHSAQVADLCRRGVEFGIVTGSVSVDRRSLTSSKAAATRSARTIPCAASNTKSP